VTIEELRGIERAVQPIAPGGVWPPEVDDRIRIYNEAVAAFREIVVRARNAIVRGAPLAPGSEEKLREVSRRLTADREDIVRTIG